MPGHSEFTMDEDAVWAAIDRQRSGLADLLEDLSDHEWACSSLCTDWSVRDVVAHLTLAHTGPARAMIDLARAGGSIDRMIHDAALRHATAAPSQLLAELRAMAGSRRLAPAITCLEPLVDLLVHGQDITIPLERPWLVPVEEAATAATRVWTMGWPLSRAFPIRSRLRDLHLLATDVNWSVGQGPRVQGPITALLLLMTGRTACLDQLHGDGLPAIYSRIN